MAETFNTTLMENVVTLLAYDDAHGKVVAALVDPSLFEGDFRLLATKIIEYWHQFGQAPKSHTADLLAEVLDDPQNRKAGTYRRILTNMLALSESMNTAYVVDQVRTFSRMQRLKDAILKSAEQLNSKQQHAIGEVEDIWNGLLRSREIDYDPGIRLSEIDRVLSYLSQQFGEFKTGVGELDRRNIVPYRGGVMLWLGAAKAGKSWALINCGKHALLQRKKVVHVTLEMSAEEVTQRYYQALFSVPKRSAEVKVTTLDLRDGVLEGFGEDTVEPDFSFDSIYLREELETRITGNGRRFENILIKQFPPRSLTASGLRGYLDNIEITEKFIPDILILDYIGIMQTDAKNHRISLGRVFEEFRAICVERKIAGVTAAQLSKAGAEAIQSSSTHVAEDWSLIGTADQVVSYSATDAERRFGLARLFVPNARAEQDRFGVLITQNYQLGQFCLDSVYLKPSYFDKLKDLVGEDEPTPESDDDDGYDE
jgi:replicative DNA helicase